jgi:hypothetical protein
MEWQKSSFSNPNGNSIEVRERAGLIELRESDRPHTFVQTSREKISAFFAGVKAGEFDHLIEE